MKKFIKLINNERINQNVSSKTALVDNAVCDATSNDNCTTIDFAKCTVYSTDVCNKDMAACSTYATDHCNMDHAACVEGAWDVCSNYRDIDLCIGAGNNDTDN